MEDRYVSCGAIIPEGRQVCESCEKGNRRFTDDEVIKALECCFVHSNCTNCPLASPPKTDCLKRAGIRAVAVFNRQKAEIERVKEILNRSIGIDNTKEKGCFPFD